MSSRGCASDSSGGDLSGQQLRWIVSSSAGGGFDTTTRQLEPYFTKEIDANAVVENHEGGGYAIGAQTMLTAGADCTSIVTHGVPHLQFSYMTQEVDFDLVAFAPVGGISIEPGVLRVNNDAPWQTIKDFVEDARERPGQIKVSVSDLQSNNYIALLQMEQALGIDLDIIGYDGGGPSRTALITNEVDATHAGVFNSLSIADETRVLAVTPAREQMARRHRQRPADQPGTGRRSAAERIELRAVRIGRVPRQQSRALPAARRRVAGVVEERGVPRVARQAR